MSRGKMLTASRMIHAAASFPLQSVRTLIQGLKDFPDFGQINTVEIRDKPYQAEQKIPSRFKSPDLNRPDIKRTRFGTDNGVV